MIAWTSLTYFQERTSFIEIFPDLADASDLADVVDRVRTSLQFGMDTLQADHFAVVDQCVPSLKSQIVDRKDDRLENADVVVVERTVDEDPRRPPPHS